MKRVLPLQLRRLLSKLNGNHNSNKNFIPAVNRDQPKKTQVAGHGSKKQVAGRKKLVTGKKRVARIGKDCMGRRSQNTNKKNSRCIQNLFPVCFKWINLLNVRGIFKKPQDLFGRIKVSWKGSFGPHFQKIGHLRK